MKSRLMTVAVLLALAPVAFADDKPTAPVAVGDTVGTPPASAAAGLNPFTGRLDAAARGIEQATLEVKLRELAAQKRKANAMEREAELTETITEQKLAAVRRAGNWRVLETGHGEGVTQPGVPIAAASRPAAAPKSGRRAAARAPRAAQVAAVAPVAMPAPIPRPTNVGGMRVGEAQYVLTDDNGDLRITPTTASMAGMPGVGKVAPVEPMAQVAGPSGGATGVPQGASQPGLNGSVILPPLPGLPAGALR